MPSSIRTRLRFVFAAARDKTRVSERAACKIMLLSMRSVKAFYNSISTALAALRVNSPFPRRTVSQQLLHKLIFRCEGDDRGDDVTCTQWYFYVAQQKKKKPNKDDWLQITLKAQVLPVCTVTGMSEAARYFGKHGQTGSPVIKTVRPTPFSKVPEYQSRSLYRRV